MSRREQIVMTAAETGAFLEEQRTVICASNGRDGWPHLMPLWYIVRDEQVWAWTFRKSQKVRNLERDPRATLQIEAGEHYHELRGVMIEADAVIHDHPSLVQDIGVALFLRYSGPEDTGEAGAAAAEGMLAAIRGQAAKRVAIQFATRRVASWDHRKLAGVY